MVARMSQDLTAAALPAQPADAADTGPATKAADRIQLVSAACGPIQILLLVVAVALIARLVPLPSPAWSAQFTADFYSAHAGRIKAGLAILVFVATLNLPFSAALSAQLRRMEGSGGPLTLMQFGAGALNALLLMLPAIAILAVSYRSPRDAQAVQLMSDFAWLAFVSPVGPTVLQALTVAVATFAYPRRAVFAPWVGYFNAWAAFIFLPGSVVAFFYSGPLAWSGLLAFYIPLAVFGAWYVVNFIAIRQAVLRR